MKRLATAVMAASGLLLLAAVVLAGVAIWTVGPDAGRWAGTAALVGFVGVLVGLLGAELEINYVEDES